MKSIYLKQTKFVLVYVWMTRIEIHNFKNIAMNYIPTCRGTTLDGFSEKRSKIGPLLFKGAVSAFFCCHRYSLHLNHESRPIIYIHRKSISPYNLADCKLFAGKDT